MTRFRSVSLATISGLALLTVSVRGFAFKGNSDNKFDDLFNRFNPFSQEKGSEPQVEEVPVDNTAAVLGGLGIAAVEPRTFYARPQQLPTLLLASMPVSSTLVVKKTTATTSTMQ